MDELNKRYAKVLGWYFCERDKFWKIDECSLNAIYAFITDVREPFKFHESYDWAMLLVEAIKEFGGDLYIALNKLPNPIKFQTIDPQGENYTSECEWAMTSWLFSFTPQQLSQAALEVWEGQKVEN